MSYDVVLVGVGGQGILTLADLMVRCAFESDVAISYCPTKGMAQRGGFVKAEVRLGEEGVGPRISDGQADLVIAMERSEGLKGLAFLKPGGTFVLFDHVWEPTGVQLGMDDYPKRDEALEEIERVATSVLTLDPQALPSIDGQEVRPNIYILGAAVGQTGLGGILSQEAMETTIRARWPKLAAANLAAFNAGATA